MFTGLVQEVGEVLHIKPKREILQVEISATFKDELKIGESVCVSGACLTVVEITPIGFVADIMPETLKLTWFNRLKPGIKVNLERALRLSDRLGGHILTGHIDGTATVKEINLIGETRIITFSAESRLTEFMILKGSVAVDGVSLTLTDVTQNSFSVAIIPHTLKNTTLKYLSINSEVNIETDIILKYIHKLAFSYLMNKNTKDQEITIEFLEEHGFA